MRELIDLCTTIDRHAHATYELFAESASSATLAEVFEQLARDESAHAEWWDELRRTHDKGLVPDMVNEAAPTLERLRDIEGELAGIAEAATRDDDSMIEAAVRMEFYLLDPVFAELIELTEPGSGERHRNAYSAHVERIARMIEEHYHRSQLAAFLAGVLRRSWHDQARAALQSRHDPLTGLLNRRGLFTYVDQWMAWAQRYGKPLGIILVDVDDFKQVNDTYGHVVGDDTLRAVAAGLRRSVRAADIVGRYGGDEFAIVVPEADGIGELLARVVSEVPVEAQHFAEPGVPRVTVSAGAAVSDAERPATATALITAADESLYSAKAGGRACAGPVGHPRPSPA